MPIPKVQVIKNSAPMPEFSRTFMQTLRNESNDTEKHEKFIKTQYHLNSLERIFLFANAVMTLTVMTNAVMTGRSHFRLTTWLMKIVYCLS